MGQTSDAFILSRARMGYSPPTNHIHHLCWTVGSMPNHGQQRKQGKNTLAYNLFQVSLQTTCQQPKERGTLIRRFPLGGQHAPRACLQSQRTVKTGRQLSQAPPKKNPREIGRGADVPDPDLRRSPAHGGGAEGERVWTWSCTGRI